jgi:hypothetical protein
MVDPALRDCLARHDDFAALSDLMDARSQSCKSRS